MHAMITLSALFLTVTGALAAAPATTRSSGDPVEAMRWQRRVVIVFSAPATGEKLAQQRAWFATDAAGFAERNVAIVEVVGDAVTVDGTATPTDAAGLARLRERFAGRPELFAVVLVGLDGDEKLRRDEPAWPALLFEAIDRMPMRRAEEAHR